jgi:hypothetical protein
VSPTLASAALASVPAERSGMAAGAVNTMRQLGFALGIAVLGAVAHAQIGSTLGSASVPTPADVADKLVGGQAQSVLAAAGSGRAALDAAIHASFASALNEALLVAAVIGAAGATLCAVLLRPPRAATDRDRWPQRAASSRAGSPAE